MAYNNDTFEFFPTKVLASEAHEFDWRDDFIEWAEDYQLNYEGVEISNAGGYQSKGNFYLELKDDSFEPFREKIVKQIESAVVSYSQGIELQRLLSTGSNLRLSNIWFNINPPGAYNHIHVHPGSLLSGVLWIKAPKESGNLFLRDPLEMNSYCLGDNAISFPPEEGTMMLFPSYLPHDVGTNMSEETRISVSFNLDFG
ncbi:hypothetical protein T040910_221 [Synechococcus phage S-CAM3]|uniref:Uncharacterized protein n=1 Tax=Synechococcus phage S-CAM3 TaxID=1883366 RepID=A0A1D8KJX6_9CAUD|nr:2OG-Fe(II) oxygenase [Synechococcus phage S-CAM3]AOV58726.1 hypothetical protein S250808_221 [Synechococcus phage S-CAM3]AOV58965.1 hypothetical protein T040910_221 [Synechococcus phage S-CAM3]AOV59205.1 hypothetical protein C421010_222 [Synechococcus phage S-CAM3]